MKMETNEIEIPKDMLARKTKLKSVRVYALSHHTLGISFKSVPEWSKRSFWEGEAKVNETSDSYIVILPKKVSGFYSITPDNIGISVSPKSNTIQIDFE